MIAIEPKQGIRLNLGTYCKIRSYQGGGEFWEHQNQQVLLQYLGEFLPRAVENEGGKTGTVLFTHLVDGKDVLCQSTELGANGGSASEKQLTRLRDAVAALKAKESDPLIDPNARKLIQAFRLPDPQKDSELYRIVSGSPRQLLVLWGVEKEHNSALAPQAAVARLSAGPSNGGPWKWIIGLLILLLITGLAWRFLNDSRKPTVADSGTTMPLVESQKTTLANEKGPGEATVPPSSDVPRETTVETIKPATQPQPAIVAPAKPETQPDPLSAEKPKADNSVTNKDKTNPASSTSRPPDGTKSANTPPSTTTETGSSLPKTGDTTKERPLVNPTEKRDPSAQPQPLKNSPTGTPIPETALEKPLSPLLTKPIATTPADQKLPPPELPKSSAPLPAAATPPAPQPAINSPAVPMATDDMKIEITNTRTGTTQRDGKVEVVLGAIGRDGNGKLIPIASIKRWTIGGSAATDASGELITSPTLPMTLSKGSHKVVVEGADRSGKPITAEADVQVGIKTVETPDVTVTPRTKPRK